jgi:transcriptional regulator with XRE-family HTH domain
LLQILLIRITVRNHDEERGPIDYKVALGNAIQKRRAELELTQEEVAVRANLRVGYVNRSEHGQTEFHLERFRAIARALDTTPQALMDAAWLKETNAS